MVKNSQSLIKDNLGKEQEKVTLDRNRYYSGPQWVRITVNSFVPKTLDDFRNPQNSILVILCISMSTSHSIQWFWIYHSRHFSVLFNNAYVKIPFLWSFHTVTWYRQTLPD